MRRGGRGGGERGEGGEPAGAAAADHRTRGVEEAARAEGAHGGRRVADVDDAPLAEEALPGWRGGLSDGCAGREGEGAG